MRCGPTGTGETRSDSTGSVMTRTPSISTSTLECPNQIARRPYVAARSAAGDSAITGILNCGWRICPWGYRRTVSQNELSVF